MMVWNVFIFPVVWVRVAGLRRRYCFGKENFTVEEDSQRKVLDMPVFVFVNRIRNAPSSLLVFDFRRFVLVK